eukprot:9185186-Ditylum_brightwellii.AAC.1
MECNIVYINNTEDPHRQGKMVLNQGTEEDLKTLQESKLDAGYRASDLSHMKWEGLVINQKEHCSDCLEKGLQYFV